MKNMRLFFWIKIFLQKNDKKIAKSTEIMYNKIRLVCIGGKAMKKYIILAIIIIVLVMLISSITMKVQAIGLDVFTNPDAYKENNEDNSRLVPIGNTIVWVIRTVGIAISTLMLTIIGIKYITGSVEEKAEYKQTMWPYLLGAFFLFAGSSITGVLYNLFNN